jgi:hypothetical protein
MSADSNQTDLDGRTNMPPDIDRIINALAVERDLCSAGLQPAAFAFYYGAMK